MNFLWPDTAQADDAGEIWLGGCSATALAAQFGTPLYVFDEATLRAQSRAYRAALASAYPGASQTAYAAKAFLCTAIAQLFDEEGLELDVVSGGELSVALHAGFPPERIHFHGNNKTPVELAEALSAGVGRIVVDNFHELETLSELAQLAAQSGGPPIAIWLRLAPGVQAHTHAHIQTGQEDTKFGFSMASGAAERAVAEAMADPRLDLLGLHAHIGSQIHDPEALATAAERLVEFARTMRDRHGLELRELSPGGGWGVPMVEDDAPAPVAPYVETVSAAIVTSCHAAGLPLPRLVLEPGRSLVARAGVALYTVGARKEVPGVRTYVAVDGGMADNIRPALYGAAYTARLVRPGNRPIETVTIAGKFCESGDVLIRDVSLPHPHPGDLLAMPMAGAYTLSMASNYNLAPRPAVVLVSDGHARLMQRRETYADLARRDLRLRVAPPASTLPFHKYQALGNDYLVLDPTDWPSPPDSDSVRRLCDRHRGIGADGVLWGPFSRDDGAEGYGLRLFNPDGGEFAISGNGARIFARYLWDRGLPRGPEFTLNTPAGPVRATVLDAAGERIALEMGTLTFDAASVPFSGVSGEALDALLDVDGATLRITAASIGNPHCVVFTDAQSEAARRALGLVARRCADGSAGSRLGPGAGAARAFPGAHQRAVRAGCGSPHAAHRDLGTRRGLHAGIGNIQLRCRGRSGAPGPLRQPGDRADGGGQTARGDRRRLARAAHRRGRVRVPGRRCPAESTRELRARLPHVARRLLEPVGHFQHAPIGSGAPDDLDAERETLYECRRHRNGRVARSRDNPARAHPLHIGGHRCAVNLSNPTLLDREWQHLDGRQYQEIIARHEFGHPVEQTAAEALSASQLDGGHACAQVGVPQNLGLELVARAGSERLHMFLNHEVHTHVPVGHERLVRTGEVGLRIFNDTAERLEGSALSEECGADARLQWQP